MKENKLREPLINYAISLAYRLIHSQGDTLTACMRLVKSVSQRVDQPASPVERDPACSQEAP
ncbi:MAG: hypothetical protein BMS9Abin25_1402 [Gammaproteobacteria bacterium]|nr:MAG: hypothetical protein BMS9Abin25_1402 [Gammaproteobacteria bacterium]